jgi:hypothetical protein
MTMHIKLKRLIAYLIMRGVRLSTDFLKLIILTSSPIRFILTKWFSKRMINFYALATATYLITYSLPHIFDVLKLFDKRYRHLYWIKHRAKNALSSCTTMIKKGYVSPYAIIDYIWCLKVMVSQSYTTLSTLNTLCIFLDAKTTTSSISPSSTETALS